MSYTRFAVYYVPPEGAFAQFGASWLGWDLAQGRVVSQPDLPGLAAITEAPRKYGFHATLKPPFRLAAHSDLPGLEAALDQVTRHCAPAQCAGLCLTPLGRFLALTPRGEALGIARIASHLVTQLDPFRAPATPEDLERRMKPHLTARQKAHVMQWGYAHVHEEFRFHMTLTGRMPKPDLPLWRARVQEHAPRFPAPFVLDQVALVAERSDGRFEMLGRYPLAG